MRKKIIVIFGLLISNHLNAAQLMFPLPPRAQNPSHIIFRPGLSEEDSFWMKVPFPDTPALTHYDKVFSDWVPCQSPAKEWVGSVDEVNGSDQFIHHEEHYWVSSDNREAVILSMQYQSISTAPLQKPDNDMQFVSVTLDTIPDAVAFLGELKVACNPNVINKPG